MARIMPEENPTSWMVHVISGPSSEDNLLTTLVSWSRHRGEDPHRYHLSMHDGGRTLYLKGFDRPTLKDFLRYAEYSSIPALETSPPQPMAAPPPVVAPGPPIALGGGEPGADGQAPHHPSSLSAASIQMVMGTAQILADRATDVRDSEHWVTTMLSVPEVKPEQVGLLLRLIGDPDLDTSGLALAESEMLRHEGSTLLKVPAPQIPQTLSAALNPAGGVASAKPVDAETQMRAKIFAKALDAHGQHWKDIGERLRQSRAKGQPELQGLIEGAVFINEEEANVQWVVPNSVSPVVKALTGYVLEAHRLLHDEMARQEQQSASWVTPSRRETFCALETARRATLMAARVGVEFRWVVLLSTSFAEGKEPSFGLPVGAIPPWEAPATPAAAPAAAPAAGAPTAAPSTGGIKRSVAPPVAGPGGFAKFAQELDAPLDPWLQRCGVEVGLIRSRRRSLPTTSAVTAKPGGAVAPKMVPKPAPKPSAPASAAPPS